MIRQRGLLTERRARFLNFLNRVWPSFWPFPCAARSGFCFFNKRSHQVPPFLIF